MELFDLRAVLGARIKSWRDDPNRKMSQADFAKKLGWTSNSPVSDLEKGAGKHLPEWETLVKIGEVLGVTPIELLVPPGYKLVRDKSVPPPPHAIESRLKAIEDKLDRLLDGKHPAR